MESPQQLYHLLVVDDDRRLRGLLEKYLSDKGFMITAVDSAENARHVLNQEDINLIILDVMMPCETGIEFTEKLRQDKAHPKNDVPILMLTALSDPQQRIEGLEKGADDYLTKPFEPKELLLRIQRILERVNSSNDQNMIIMGDIHYDRKRKILLHNHKIIILSSAEQKLLEVLVAHVCTELSREELAVHMGIPMSPRSIDVQVTRLRRKIERDPKQPFYLRTVRHKGYGLYPD